jgi:four helix bundle protein
MDMAKEIYLLASLLPKEETVGLRSQLTRASSSVSANIAEGWTRETDPDRAHFLAIAQGSLAETDTLLTLAEELNLIPTERSTIARELLVEVSKMLSTLRKQLRERKRR